MLTKFGIVGWKRRTGALGSLGLSLLGIVTIIVGFFSAFDKGQVSPAVVFVSIGFVFVFGATGYFSLLGKGFALILASGWLAIAGAVLLSYVLGVVTKAIGLPILRPGSFDFWSLIFVTGFCLLEGFFLYLASSNNLNTKTIF